MDNYYALDVFWWLDKESAKAWTLDGLLTFRHTRARFLWAQITSAPLEDLINAAEKWQIVGPEENAMTQDETRGFYKYILETKGVESLFCRRPIYPKDEILSAYCEGIKFYKKK